MQLRRNRYNLQPMVCEVRLAGLIPGYCVMTATEELEKLSVL